MTAPHFELLQKVISSPYNLNNLSFVCTALDGSLWNSDSFLSKKGNVIDFDFKDLYV